MNESQASTIHPSITIIPESPGITRYVFPTRNLHKFHHQIYNVLKFTLPVAFVLSFANYHTWGLFQGMQIFHLALAPMLLIFILDTLFLLGIFAAILFCVAMLLPSHTEITITNDYFICREIIWICHFSRRRNIAKTTKFRVGKSELFSRNIPLLNIMADMDGISIEGHYKHPMLMALGYPHSMLTSFVTELSANLTPVHSTDVTLALPSDPPTPTVQVDSQLPFTPGNLPTESSILARKPANSKIQLAVHEGLITLSLPRFGLRAPNMHYFLMGVFIISSYLSLSILQVVFLFMHKKVFFPFFNIPTLGGLFLGFILVLRTLVFMVKKSVLVISPTSITLLEQGLLGKKEKHWNRKDLFAIGVDSGSIPFIDRELLQIHLKQRGNYASILTGRSIAELEWIVIILCSTLALPKFTRSSSTVPLLLKR